MTGQPKPANGQEEMNEPRKEGDAIPRHIRNGSKGQGSDRARASVMRKPDTTDAESGEAAAAEPFCSQKQAGFTSAVNEGCILSTDISTDISTDMQLVPPLVEFTEHFPA